jgi:hypothetical protein
VDDPRPFLAGEWRVERALTDAALGDGAFSGTATFAPRGDELAWEERGRLRLGSYDGPARRSLRVVAADAAWEVRFADGRAFHPLDLSGGACAVTHPCGEDVYSGAYEVLGDDAFVVRWTVRGPHKDQRIVSRYDRA